MIAGVSKCSRNMTGIARQVQGVSRRATTSKSSPSNNNGSTSKMVFPLAFGIGSLAGTGGSLAGMGGGFIMIPLMTSVLKLTQHQAHGTSLFAVTATGLAGAISYGDQVQYETAAAVAFFGVISSRFGAKLTHATSEKVLKRALGVMMLAMAPIVPLKTYFLQQKALKKEQSNSQSVTEMDLLQRLLVPSAIGLCSGFLAGVFGVGGGVIVVPALAMASDITHYQALATSLAAMTLPAVVGTYTHYTAGNVAMRVAPFLSLGAFAGAYIGARIAVHTDEAKLRWGFSGLLASVGIRTLIKA